MMDESRYHKLVGEAFKRIEKAVIDVDPSDIDFDSAGDVMSLTMRTASNVS